MFTVRIIALPVLAAFLLFGLTASVAAKPPTDPPAAPVQVMNIPLPVTVTDGAIDVEGEVTVDGAVTIENTSPIPVAVDNVEQQYTRSGWCNLDDPTFSCELSLGVPAETRFVIEYINASLYSTVYTFWGFEFSCEFEGSPRDYYLPPTQIPTFQGDRWMISENVTIFCDSAVEVSTGRVGQASTGGEADFSFSGYLIPNPD
jgi:hypothetical protein